MANRKFSLFGSEYLKDSTTIQDYLVPPGTTGACGIVVDGEFAELWFTSAQNPTANNAQYTQWDLNVPITR